MFDSAIINGANNKNRLILPARVRRRRSKILRVCWSAGRSSNYADELQSYVSTVALWKEYTDKNEHLCNKEIMNEILKLGENEGNK